MQGTEYKSSNESRRVLSANAGLGRPFALTSLEK